MVAKIVSLLSLSIATTYAQSTCQAAYAPADPIVEAKGLHARVIAKGFNNPRGIVFDKDDNLLIVEKNSGLTALKFKDENGCVTLDKKVSLLRDSSLNHGIDITPDGNELFASSKEAVFSWGYNAKETKLDDQKKTWVTGMDQSGHTSRTLLLSKKAPGTLLVSRGSGPNLDKRARDINSGVSQIRSFDVKTPKQYKYTDGKVIGWGLRNSVGLGENPADGGIWSNENSSDNMLRDGKDIHENSPGEEINYHGTLAADSELHGRNYGYPECAAVWEPGNLPRNSQLRVGMQFAFNNTLSANGIDDDACAKKFVAPRLTLPSHWAPLDIEFNSKGSVAYMTSHGSWNKENADGYQLFAITFDNGQPTHTQTSRTAAVPLVLPKNMRTCGKGLEFFKPCFRPVGVAFDSKGRLFMSSDNSGEIFVITKADGTGLDSWGVQDIESLQGSRPS